MDSPLLAYSSLLSQPHPRREREANINGLKPKPLAAAQ